MRFKLVLLLFSIFTFFLFIIFSYTVAKEVWQQFDFDLTVKLQDRTPRIFDELFSYFSFIGSAEVTVGLAGVLSLWYLIRLKPVGFIGWLLILPASIFEVFGKLMVFHPGPPVLFHRSVIPTHLPSFYIHTNFSYPSGHMTRIIFLTTIFIVLTYAYVKNVLLKMVIILSLLGFSGAMFITRIYLGEHWFSDVLGGVLLGLSSGLLASVLILKSKNLRKQKLSANM